MNQTIARPIAEVFATAGRLDEYRPYQMIATDDIGKFVALAFDRPEDFIGSELEIAGSELTNHQAAEVFARVLGRPVKFRRLPMLIVRVALGKEFFHVFHWFNDSGYRADVKGPHARYAELQLRTLEERLRKEGWEGERERTVRRDKLSRPLTQTSGDADATEQSATPPPSKGSRRLPGDTQPARLPSRDQLACDRGEVGRNPRCL